MIKYDITEMAEAVKLIQSLTTHNVAQNLGTGSSDPMAAVNTDKGTVEFTNISDAAKYAIKICPFFKVFRLLIIFKVSPLPVIPTIICINLTPL